MKMLLLYTFQYTMHILSYLLHSVSTISLCRASNLLRRIFIIDKSYLNKRILFNSFTYLSVCVCVCVFHHSPLPSHITRAIRTGRLLPSALVQWRYAFTLSVTPLFARAVDFNRLPLFLARISLTLALCSAQAAVGLLSLPHTRYRHCAQALSFV